MTGEFPENTETPMPVEETQDLISSDKVEGTDVYDLRGDKIGHIRSVMLDKRSGAAEYAVMSFGGFLGIGERYHPVPWKALTYDPDRGGYVVGLNAEKLKDAPNYGPEEEPAYDQHYALGLYGFYGLGVPPFGAFY